MPLGRIRLSPREALAGTNGGAVQSVLESEQERRRDDGLGDLGADTFSKSAF